MTGLLHMQGFCRLVILNAGKLITLEKILDPFCGSGTTGIAALGNQRRFVGIDLERDHLELAKRRALYLAST